MFKCLKIVRKVYDVVYARDSMGTFNVVSA